MAEEPKAKVALVVTYLGKEYELYDDLDVSYGFGEALSDMVAALDYDIREARSTRVKFKNNFRAIRPDPSDPNIIMGKRG